ncbi:hypothetical protein [Zoogloea dura]|uniref:Uncharacterized protein n=1 Tax=Zoogloea dura TaxID=2728840 RepID=A0A848G9Q8_9RHOO|nr:hypothetical protein [Zoogloea dura]NML28004.1 hypothetical protein [Zoogloea dura]
MLFTVTATFSDFTTAYEQYEVASPAEALDAFILNAESLGAFDPKLRALAVGAEGHKIVHVAGGRQGLWTWHLTAQLEQDEVALYGGCIVQTDRTGPVRPHGAV